MRLATTSACPIRHLGISPTTVKTHLHIIFERMGVSGRTLLALRAAEGDVH